MTETEPRSKVLQMVVKIQWTVDNLRTLGTGSMYHLAYRPSEVSYDVLVDISAGRIRPGAAGEVIFVGGQRPMKVADVAIQNVIASKGFRRFDFRIVRIPQTAETCQAYAGTGFLCRYGPADLDRA